MKRYFKHDAESDAGEGFVYFEITDDWPTRQVEIYGDVWRLADREHPKDLADQPFEVLELSDEHVVSHEVFEHVWKDAVQRCPPTS